MRDDRGLVWVRADSLALVVEGRLSGVEACVDCKGCSNHLLPSLACDGECGNLQDKESSGAGMLKVVKWANNVLSSRTEE